MATAEKSSRSIDTQSPVTRNEPALYTGAHAMAPMALPRNLATSIPAPFPFNFIAIFHDPFSFALLVALSGFTVYEWFWLTPKLPLLWAVVVPLILLALTPGLPFLIAPRRAVQRAIVIYKTTAGRTEVDGEWKMWRHDARRWSDDWRWPFEDKKGRVKRWLIIDAQEYDFAQPNPMTLTPVQPWLSPMPVRPAGLDRSIPFDAPSRAELGITYALNKATREWLDVRDPKAELMSMMMIGILIGVALFAMFLGGDRAAAQLSNREQSAIEAAALAAVSAKVQAQVQGELERMISSGQITIKEAVK